jgi:phosphate:Na+ symporter
VQTAVAVFAEPDELEIQLLQGMTADRGDLMERIRSIHLAGGEGMPIEARSSLLYLTTLFERIVWTIGQLGRSIRPVPA